MSKLIRNLSSFCDENVLFCKDVGWNKLEQTLDRPKKKSLFSINVYIPFRIRTKRFRYCSTYRIRVYLVSMLLVCNVIKKKKKSFWHVNTPSCPPVCSLSGPKVFKAAEILCRKRALCQKVGGKTPCVRLKGIFLRNIVFSWFTWRVLSLHL